jgi:hypothetical protein
MTDWISPLFLLMAILPWHIVSLCQHTRFLHNFYTFVLKNRPITVQQALEEEPSEESSLESLQKTLLSHHGWELFHTEETHPVAFYHREKTLEEKLEEHWFGQRKLPNASAWVKFTETGDCVRVEHENAWVAVAYEFNRLLQQPMPKPLASEATLAKTSFTQDLTSLNSNVSSNINM